MASTNNLTDLQQVFQSYMVTDNNEAIDLIESPQHLDTTNKVRMDVYRNAYFIRLTEIIAMDTPALKAFLGSERFEKIAENYIKANTAHEFSIRNFSANFPKFLAKHYSNEPIFKELARYELAMNQVQLISNAPHISLDDINAAIKLEEWPYLILNVHPSLVTESFNYNCVFIRAAHDNKQTIPKAEKLSEKTTWAIWSYDQHSFYLSLDSTGLPFFKALRNGLCFAQACEQLCEYMPEDEVGPHAASLLQNWINSGMFTSFSLL